MLVWLLIGLFVIEMALCQNVLRQFDYQPNVYGDFAYYQFAYKKVLTNDFGLTSALSIFFLSSATGW